MSICIFKLVQDQTRFRLIVLIMLIKHISWQQLKHTEAQPNQRSSEKKRTQLHLRRRYEHLITPTTYTGLQCIPVPIP